MTTNTTEPQQLTEDAVREIEARATQCAELPGVGQFGKDALALIRDWRAMRTEIKDYEQTDLVPRTRYNVVDVEAREAREMVSTVANKAKVAIERLESENTALRQELARVTAEYEKVQRQLEAEYEQQAGADL